MIFEPSRVREPFEVETSLLGGVNFCVYGSSEQLTTATLSSIRGRGHRKAQNVTLTQVTRGVVRELGLTTEVLLNDIPDKAGAAAEGIVAYGDSARRLSRSYADAR